VSRLKPVFRLDGTVTAGNACPLNDGAAAVIVMSDKKARELGITPLARIVSTAVTGLSAEIMGLGPVTAIPAALKQAGLSIGDIDLFEINEAFAVQALGSAQQLGVDIDKLNVNGGAIAVGHPFGMTGASNHEYPDQLTPAPRQAVRRRVDVRRWWHGHGNGDRTAVMNGRVSAVPPAVVENPQQSRTSAGLRPGM